MQKQDNFNIQDDVSTDDVISLTDILAPLWHSRWMILLVTVLVMVFGLARALQHAQYQSEGFFQFGGAIPADRDKDKEPDLGISLADYKRYAASYGTSERFANYVKEKTLGLTPGINELKGVFASPEGIAKLVEPVYPFTKLDAKELIEQPKDSRSNNVIGLRISYASDSPEKAQQMVGLLGSYAMDSIVYLIYSDELRFKHGEIMAKRVKLDNVIISKRELLAKYQRNGADLKQIVNRYPESAKQVSRQVISVTDDSARYLSPVTLLVTTEVQESEAKEAIHKAKREQQQGLLWLEYYDRAKVLLDSTQSGEAILLGLEPIKESVFKGKNLENEVVKEVYNTITIDNQKATTLYLGKSRFIAGPTLPSRSTARPLMVLAVSLMLGLFLSFFLVFARNWWRDNWQKISD